MNDRFLGRNAGFNRNMVGSVLKRLEDFLKLAEFSRGLNGLKCGKSTWTRSKGIK